MDVERTIEFLLENHARWEVRMQKAEERMEKAGERHEKQMAGIRKVLRETVKTTEEIKIGLKALTHAHRQTEISIRELAEAQKVTEKKLHLFLTSLQKGRNGH